MRWVDGYWCARIGLLLLPLTLGAEEPAWAQTVMAAESPSKTALEIPPPPGSGLSAVERAIAQAEKAIERAERISTLADLMGRKGGSNPLAWEAPDEPIVLPADAGQLDQLIMKNAQQHGLDPDLIRALIRVESNFNSGAVSHKGAQGLMQLMPETARRYGVRELTSPEENLAGGVRYLSDLLQMFNGNVPLALAAYNAGEGLVGRLQRIPDIPETRDYVQRISRMFDFRRSPYLLQQ